MDLIDPIVTINGQKYVLWHDIDEYKVNSSIHATPLEDWKKINKEYESLDEFYIEFTGIFVFDYKDLKSCAEDIFREEEEE